MAGAGVRLFTAGSQLLASQVNTYLMDQVVCYFADSATRDAAFGGAGEPSLSPGRICYLFSDNKLYLYGNDNAWTEIGAQLDNLEVTTAKLAASAVTSAKLSSSLSLTGTTSFEQILEKAVVSGSALSSTTNLDALSGAVYYNTASTTSNITLNLRGDGSNTLASLVPAGKIFSCVFMITSGSVNGKISSITAGSSTVNVKWFAGSSYPSGSNGGSVDAYTLTAVKTDDAGNGTFTVFASQSKFA